MPKHQLLSDELLESVSGGLELRSISRLASEPRGLGTGDLTGAHDTGLGALAAAPPTLGFGLNLLDARGQPVAGVPLTATQLAMTPPAFGGAPGFLPPVVEPTSHAPQRDDDDDDDDDDGPDSEPPESRD